MSTYKTVFHALIAAIPNPKQEIDDKNIDELVKATIRIISEQLQELINTYNLIEYAAKITPNLSQDEFTRLVLFIGLMDIYQHNILIHDENNDTIYYHHIPLFNKSRKTMVFLVRTDGVGGATLEQIVDTEMKVEELND